MRKLEYQEYFGTIEFSAEDGILFGKICGINDLVLFEGESITKLEYNFKESVDDYLETCKVIGKEPNKSY